MELPSALAEFLKDKELACVTQATDRGTVYVVKLPGREIGSLRGRVPIQVRHELYEHPAAPVIRTILTIYDQPDCPLALETFINVEDESQRADFAALASQEDLILLFYDETLTHALSKRLRNDPKEAVTQILVWADQILAVIPKERFDFDRAKLEVMRRTGWPPRQ